VNNPDAASGKQWHKFGFFKTITKVHMMLTLWAGITNSNRSSSHHWKSIHSQKYRATATARRDGNWKN